MPDYTRKPTTQLLVGTHGYAFGTMAQFRNPEVSLRARAIHALLVANPYPMDLESFINSASNHEDDSREEILEAIDELEECGWILLYEKTDNPHNDFIPVEPWDSKKPKRGFVYLIKGLSGSYLIGSTEEILSEHLIKVKYEHPGDIELITHLESWDIEREQRYLEELFFQHRCHGKWLWLDPKEVLKEVVAKFYELNMDPNKEEA